MVAWHGDEERELAAARHEGRYRGPGHQRTRNRPAKAFMTRLDALDDKSRGGLGGWRRDSRNDRARAREATMRRTILILSTVAALA